MPSLNDKDGLRRLEKQVATLDRFMKCRARSESRYPAGNPQERLAVVLDWFDSCWELLELFQERCRRAVAARRMFLGLKLMEIRAVLGPLWESIVRYTLDVKGSGVAVTAGSRIVATPQQAGYFAALMAEPMKPGTRLC